ncbi:OmpA family protein [bacterium]|nr:OmpA family protein [bacterium]
MKKYIDVKLVSEGLLIDLLEAKQSLFFDAGSARVKPGTQHLLAQIANELGKLPNNIIIEGHTDSRPLARSDGYTNWELSSDRANSARRVMESAGLRSNQIDQVRGYAATHPRTPQDPTHFSNRRVSIIVVMKGRSTEAPSLSIGSDIINSQSKKTNTEQHSSNPKVSHINSEPTGSTKPALDPSNPIGINTSFGPVTKH